MDSRLNALYAWLTDVCKLKIGKVQAMPGDASFRRYFRVTHERQTYVAMDAPPELENCIPYIAIAKALRVSGLESPKIIQDNLSQGFLLLSDFGDQQFLKELNSTNVTKLYRLALNALAIMQGCRQVDGWKIPLFTVQFMYQELLLFKEWFLQKHLGLTLTASVEKMLVNHFNILVESAANQLQVFMHRDYHSANLMVLPHDHVGILDFQDAFIGPVTYDLVSLLRDCYIDWPEPLVMQFALQYRDQLNLAINDNEFLRWFDWMGLQRHMKALLTFSRKYQRDGNANYLRYIPRTLNYIMVISDRYTEFKEFSRFLHAVILPTYEKVSHLCVE